MITRAPGAVAIDLDGTLLDSRSRLSERSQAAVEGCIAYGIPVVIATSRAARSVHRLLGEELTSRCSLVLMNGAVARGVSPLSGFVREGLPKEAATGVVELVLGMQPEFRLVVELDGYEFGMNTPLDPETLWEINSATPDMVVSLSQALAGKPTKVAVSGLGRDVSTIAAELSKRFGDVLSVIPADGATFLNITSSMASKPDALRQLLQPHGISLADVLAFGDDVPDVGMLEACGISVAVANAAPEAIAAAKYRTASNDDYGVALVLERVLKVLRE